MHKLQDILYTGLHTFNIIMLSVGCIPKFLNYYIPASTHNNIYIEDIVLKNIPQFLTIYF